MQRKTHKKYQKKDRIYYASVTDARNASATRNANLQAKKNAYIQKKYGSTDETALKKFAAFARAEKEKHQRAFKTDPFYSRFYRGTKRVRVDGEYVPRDKFAIGKIAKAILRSGNNAIDLKAYLQNIVPKNSNTLKNSEVLKAREMYNKVRTASALQSARAARERNMELFYNINGGIVKVNRSKAELLRRGGQVSGTVSAPPPQQNQQAMDEDDDEAEGFSVKILRGNKAKLRSGKRYVQPSLISDSDLADIMSSISADDVEALESLISGSRLQTVRTYMR